MSSRSRSTSTCTRSSTAKAKKAATKIATGLNVSPGAAVGQIAFDADTAEKWAKEDKKQVIMVRPETSPNDVHGMLAAKGILTSRGGRTSHAALVARQFGKPAVVGVAAMDVDVDAAQDDRRRQGLPGRRLDLDRRHDRRGLHRPDARRSCRTSSDPYLSKLLGWADKFRRLQVWANADYPRDAERARKFGAEGIGLCRTEHMFFETERLPIVQQMILAETLTDKDAAASSATRRWRSCCRSSAATSTACSARWTGCRSSSA